MGNNTKTMKVNYDQDSDILYLIVREGPIYDSKEIDDDVRVEYDKDGQIAGFEIFNTRSNLLKVFATEIATRVRQD